MRSPFKGLCFVVFTGLVTVLAATTPGLQERIQKFYRVESPSAYFHALVPGRENASWMARKLMDLPGVKKAEIVPHDKLMQETKKSLQSLGELPADMATIDDVGIKVTFQPDLSPAAQNLIRDYLQRLAGGADSIAIGQVNDMNGLVAPQKESIKSTQRMILPLTTTLLALFWLMSFLAFERLVRESAYLVEKFQRRKRVAFKAMILAQVMVIGVSGLVCFYYFPVHMISWAVVSCVLVLASLIELRRYRWVDG